VNYIQFVLDLVLLSAMGSVGQKGNLKQKTKVFLNSGSGLKKLINI
jgi:hypothetical protein